MYANWLAIDDVRCDVINWLANQPEIILRTRFDVVLRKKHSWQTQKPSFFLFIVVYKQIRLQLFFLPVDSRHILAWYREMSIMNDVNL